VWRDGVFWFALLIGLCGTAIQSPLSGWEGTTSNWARLVLQFGLTTILALVLVGVIAATFRGFGDGWRVAGAAQKRPAEKAEKAEPSAERTGPAESNVATTDPDRPAVGVNMEHKARALGRAFGAARRTYRDSD